MVCVDPRTIGITIAIFARLCTRVKLADPLTMFLEIDNSFIQLIIYEDIPFIYFTSRRIGHKRDVCRFDSGEDMDIASLSASDQVPKPGGWLLVKRKRQHKQNRDRVSLRAMKKFPRAIRVFWLNLFIIAKIKHVVFY